MQYNTLIQNIQADIYSNGAELITGDILQSVLLQMVNAWAGAGAMYGGVITPASAAPADLDQATVYLALEAGTYTNFVDSNNDPIVTAGPALITYDGGASLVFNKTDLPSGGSGATVITNDGTDGDAVAIILTDNQSYKRSFRIDMTAEYTGGANEQRIGSLIVECYSDATDDICHGYYYGDEMSDILAEVAVYQDDQDSGIFYLMLTHESSLDSVTFAISPTDGGEVDAIITNAADGHTKVDDANITEIEKTSNKVSTLSGNETNTTKYPNTKAVADALGKMGVESQTITFNADGTRTLTNVVWGIIPQGEHNIYLSCRGVEFNDTGSAISKTAPWGETVQHLPGYYYLNGLGDISRQEMADIYGRSFALTYDITRSRFSSATLRTIIPAHGGAYNWAATKNGAALFSGCSNLESLHYVDITPSASNENIPDLNTMQAFAAYCDNLYYGGIWRCTTATNVSLIMSSRTKYMWLKGLKANLSMTAASNFDLGCLAYMITNAGTTTITITVHANVYTAAQSDAGVQAALAAKTNVSLQSA